MGTTTAALLALALTAMVVSALTLGRASAATTCTVAHGGGPLVRAGLTAFLVTAVSAGWLVAATTNADAAPHTPTVGVGHARVAGQPAVRLLPQRVATATTLGQPGAVPIGCSGFGPTGAMLAEEGAGASTYIAGSDGVLTSYTYVANGVAGQVRAVVFADTATATTKAVIAKSAKQTITVSTTNTFPIRVPIKTGQHLGLALSEDLMACATAGVTGDLLGAQAPFDPDVDTTLTYTAGFDHGLRPNIAAVLEPDVDGDGFGDVSQDLCPQSQLLQTACSAPDTTVTKAPKKSSAKRKAKIAFSATVAGSRFTCAVDKKPAAPCTSPFKKKFTYGKHTVLITAISSLGVADPTPTPVTFKIKRPKR